MDLRAYVKDFRERGGSVESGLGVADYTDRVSWLQIEAAEHGFDPEFLSLALGAETDERTLRELALQLVEALADREELKKRGATHLARRHEAVPDSFINEVALQILGACIEDDLPPPEPLYVVLRFQFSATGRPSRASHDLRAKSIAALILASDPAIGVRRLARAVGVNPSSVTRWKRQPDFQRQTERLRGARLRNISSLVDRLFRQRA